MKMSISEAFDAIKSERFMPGSQKYTEAMNIIRDTIIRYQKITEIIKNTSGDEVYGDLYNKIYGVLEDGKM